MRLGVGLLVIAAALVAMVLMPLTARADETQDATQNPSNDTDAANQDSTQSGDSQSEAETTTPETQLVKYVEVQLYFSNGDLRPDLSGDLRAAIVEVGEMAILEQLEGNLTLLIENLDDVTETLKRVIDLTLAKRGFKVQDLGLTPGETTLITLTIAVSGTEILEVQVELVPPNRGALADTLLEPLRSELASSLRHRFQGLPTADVNWLMLLFKAALEEEHARISDFGYFDYELQLVPGSITRAIVTLKPAPEQEVLRRHYLRTRSSTLLNISLENLRELVLTELASMDGLPVDFVLSHESTIAGYLVGRTADLPEMKLYHATVDARLDLRGSDLRVSLIVESRRYRTYAFGRVDFNKEEKNPLIEGRFGVIGGATEAYAHLKFYPDKLDVEPEAGLGVNPMPGLFIGGGWDFDRETFKLRSDLWFGTNVLFTLEHYPDSEFNDLSEYTIAYFLTRDLRLSATLDGDGKGFVSLGVVL